MSERFDAGPVLAQLKDFQRASVDHAFGQLYDHGSDKFLVADEVGLGKTMVARGVIAKAIERMWDDIERIDVVYICSNSSIAQQNIRRLNVMPDQGFSFSSRMTMIASEVARLQGNKVNFVSFTPGTSFDLKSNTGTGSERILLHWMLHRLWGRGVFSAAGADRVLQCGISDSNWPRRLRDGQLDAADLEPGLLAAFETDLDSLDARRRFEAIASAFVDGSSTPKSARAERDLLVGQLRERLAARCVDSLEPDLVILDEFQRFRDLMSTDTPAGQLAGSLFDYPDNKTLLLSATPYKMFTRGEDADDNHHLDFLRTVEFLFGGREHRFNEAMAAFRAGLLDVHHRSVEELTALRGAVEAELRKVMVRTERLGAGDDRNGMLTEVAAAGTVEPGDVLGFVGLERLARSVGGQGMVDYWKSVPSFANFCDGYKVDHQIDDALADPERRSATLGRLRAIDDRIDWDRWRRFEPIDSANGRLRVLTEQTVDNGAWRMLWIAPSAPYHELGGAWAGHETTTKRLIFSSWAGVPKAVSSLLSYEVERRMFGLRPDDLDNTPADRQTIKGLLPFRRDLHGEPGAMNSFAFVYPSPTLARLGDPLALARERGGPVPLDELRTVVAARIADALGGLERDDEHESGREDQRWYWAAPLLLDAAADAAPWMAHKTRYRMSWLGGIDDEEASSRTHEIFDEHIDFAAAVYRGEERFGRPPADLVEVLVDAALGSPATAALRAIGHVFGDEMPADLAWHGACRMAWAFRSLFNLPDVNSLVRSADWDADYWRTATRYCVDGCLSATLDEYLHVLRESVGIYEVNPDDRWGDMVEIAAALQEAVGIRTTSLVARDHLGEADTAGPRFRTRYAMRFGTERGETERSTVTETHLRRAFNSPFWPFVLTSTSVGQEGLDFHLYCHAIMHWNLPSNPVDLEQREGRVHRFKGHAVRRNVAAAMDEAMWSSEGDPWEAMFAAAADTRSESDSELVPYWVFSGAAKIQRHVPLLPLSKEVAQLERLKRDVARYRLVFGQPRQDDLLAYLGDVPQEKLDQLRIDLAPTPAGTGSVDDVNIGPHRTPE